MIIAKSPSFTPAMLIGKCHREALKEAPRALTTVIIDDRPGKTDRITEKIRSVETKLGRELRK